LTDEEYFWEPVPDCWTLRSGRLDYLFPAPEPAPVTTIAWRLAHMIVSVLAMRNAGHFGREAVDHESFEYADTAADALAQLDEEHDRWIAGVRGLGEAGLSEPSGPAEGPWGDSSMATLVLHINRELIHHGAEVALLRDLYAHREKGS